MKNDYENFKINFELLKKILENEGNCLCKLNTKCPCQEFAFNKKCHCGVFKEK
ncbi:MAG: hypothetical protein PHG04_02920 [Candidatus Nanoarchaeia archaeon]|nr:hypothetical protein [Candidatus Nanoarchaeia archaeon]MDD5054304.1 hypothetical protein [Candidatus Nanoarchaeia archaeon]